jgi:hypothetical protein
MSFSYDRYDSRRRAAPSTRRSVFGHWVPLVLTVTIATAGIAAWVWSAREDHESSTSHSSDDDDLSYGEETRTTREQGRDNKGPPGYDGPEGVIREDEQQRGGGGSGAQVGLVADVSRGVREVMRRTPSPQQAFDSVKKYGAASVAAAGAVVGGALSSIREEGSERSPSRSKPKSAEEVFSDHERWSEEAERRVDMPEGNRGAASSSVDTFGAATRDAPSSIPKLPTGSRRKTVAVVVSGEILLEHLRDEDEGKYHSEQAVCAFTSPSTNHANMVRRSPYCPISHKSTPQPLVSSS